MKQLFLAAGLPVLPYVLVRPAAVGAGPGRDPRGRGGAGLPRLRQAGPGGVELRDQPGRRRRRTSTPRSRRPARFDPKVLVEAAAVERARGGDRRAPGARRRRPGDQRDRRDHGRLRSTRSTTSRRSTSSRATSIPASLNEDVAEQVQDLAVRAFEALDVEGLARVDFFVLARRPGGASTRSRPCPASPRPRCSRCCGRSPA